MRGDVGREDRCWWAVFHGQESQTLTNEEWMQRTALKVSGCWDTEATLEEEAPVNEIKVEKGEEQYWKINLHKIFCGWQCWEKGELRAGSQK